MWYVTVSSTLSNSMVLDDVVEAFMGLAVEKSISRRDDQIVWAWEVIRIADAQVPLALGVPVSHRIFIPPRVPLKAWCGHLVHD